ATVGFHPEDAADFEPDGAENIFELAKHERVMAIGECGLDYYRLNAKGVARPSGGLGLNAKESAGGPKPEEIKKTQKDVFLKQAYIAKELNKPLIVHCRPSQGTEDAYQDILDLFDKGIGDEIPVIMHFFAGSLKMAKKMVDLGFYFTFGGVVTFSRDYDEIIQFILIDRILAETDSPYVAPASRRGKRNEPFFILEIIQKLSEIKGVSTDKLLEALFNNSKRVFKTDFNCQ
ncbi:MAG: TatD family hydrolase, partial [Parcubacteria group bacterium Athens1014_26]